MKVLFIGPYRQLDGWGIAARSLVKSLLTTDIDLTLRHIYLASTPQIEEPIFTELENKTQSSYDVIIQNCLPEFFVHYPNVKNIGCIATETHNLKYIPWISYLNLMDEIWVLSTHEIQKLYKDGCNTTICAVSSAVDINKFSQNYNNKPKNDFIFYTIGDGERKNILSLILAFHREFDRNEPVQLMIKTSQNIIQHIQNYKQQLGIYKNIQQYKQEQLIIGHISDEDLNHLHYNSDCFVMSSYGEAWCRPALDALGFGKTPIVTDNTGMTDFINNNNGWLVNSYETPVVTANKPLPYLYTARETWYQIDILDLQRKMREAYENKELRYKKSEQGKIDVQQYSYENIGRKLYDKLCA